MIKKAIVRVKGGLGNQLFIYAFGKYLNLKYNIAVHLDTKSGFVKDEYKRKYLLDNFNIKLKECSLKEAAFIPLKKRIDFIPNNLFRNSIILQEEDFNYDCIHDNKYDKKIIYFEGYWQKLIYVEEFALSLREDLQIKKKIDPQNISLAREINNSESVAVHIRKIRFHTHINIDYYIDAIAKVKNLLPNFKLFIFSDDIEWCKNNLRINEDLFFVENNKNDEINDLWLLSQCKHFIISNSTFSWWGYWLSKDKTKIVIKPKNHFIH